MGTVPSFFFLLTGAFISINSAYTGICAPVAPDQGISFITVRKNKHCELCLNLAFWQKTFNPKLNSWCIFKKNIYMETSAYSGLTRLKLRKESLSKKKKQTKEKSNSASLSAVRNTVMTGSSSCTLVTLRTLIKYIISFHTQSSGSFIFHYFNYLPDQLKSRMYLT